MSKVVTIPKDRNPFVVIVNGVKHSYPAGVTTEVPDEVADVIEKYVGAKPKPDPNAGINFGGTQSDWNQTDSSAADFIKNKPFGEFPTVVLEEQELPYDANEGACIGVLSDSIQDGSTVSVVFDGKEYKCKAVALSFVFFGNLALIDEAEEDTGEPFCCMAAGSILLVLAMDEENHTVKLTAPISRVLPSKYSSATKFYIRDSDSYLYTDVACTIKATKNDVPRHMNFSVGITDSGITLYWLQPVFCISREYADMVGYVHVNINLENEVISVYTAEYEG